MVLKILLVNGSSLGSENNLLFETREYMELKIFLA